MSYNITYTYIDKCAATINPHVRLAFNINGTERERLTFSLSDLQDVEITDEMIKQVSLILIKGFAKQWKADNPSGTLVQFKNALEAKVWVI